MPEPVLVVSREPSHPEVAGRQVPRLALPSPATSAQWLLLLIVGAMVLYPVYWLVLGSLWSGRPGAAGFVTLANYQRMLANPEIWGLLFTSVVISGSKSVIGCIIGVFLAWLVARSDIPWRGVIETLAPLPFFLPHLLNAIGWAILANPSNGAINVAVAWLLGLEKGPFNVYTPAGIVFVLSLDSAAFVYLMMLGAMRNMDTSLEESARMSGAGRVRTFLTITLPLLLPALSGAAILTFIAGIEAFETPTILGTPGNVFVFTNEIYYQLNWRAPPDYGAAMTLSILLTGLMLLVIFLQWRLLGRRRYTTVTGRGYRPQQVSLGRWRWPVLGMFAAYVLIAVVLPIGLMIVTSFFRVFGYYALESLTLNNYTGLFSNEQFGRALTNTLILAVGGAGLAMLLSSLIAYVVVRTQFRFRRLLELVAWLPWALPGIVLSLAMLWAYIRLPIPIYGTIWVLILAYVTNGLPLGVRTMSGVMTQISPELEESARMSGASWRRMLLDVLLALVRPGFMAGWFLLGFLFMRQLSIALMLYGVGSEVLPMFALRSWEVGSGGEAAAVGTMMLLAMVGFLLLDLAVRRLERRRSRPAASATAGS